MPNLSLSNSEINQQPPQSSKLKSALLWSASTFFSGLAASASVSNYRISSEIAFDETYYYVFDEEMPNVLFYLIAIYLFGISLSTFISRLLNNAPQIKLWAENISCLKPRVSPAEVEIELRRLEPASNSEIVIGNLLEGAELVNSADNFTADASLFQPRVPRLPDPSFGTKLIRVLAAGVELILGTGSSWITGKRMVSWFTNNEKVASSLGLGYAGLVGLAIMITFTSLMAGRDFKIDQKLVLDEVLRQRFGNSPIRHKIVWFLEKGLIHFIVAVSLISAEIGDLVTLSAIFDFVLEYFDLKPDLFVELIEVAMVGIVGLLKYPAYVELLAQFIANRHREENPLYENVVLLETPHEDNVHLARIEKVKKPFALITTGGKIVTSLSATFNQIAEKTGSLGWALTGCGGAALCTGIMTAATLQTRPDKRKDEQLFEMGDSNEETNLVSGNQKGSCWPFWRKQVSRTTITYHHPSLTFN